MAILLKVMRKDFRATSADLAGVIGPPSLTPITIATCLRREQMEQRVAIRTAALVHWTIIELLVELRAELVHRVENIFVAFHPAQVIRPGTALEMKPVVALLR